MKTLLAVLVLSLTALAQDAKPVIPNDTFTSPMTIPPRTFQQVPFKISGDSAATHLVGHFRASGVLGRSGTHSEIVVCVMTHDQFMNWQNDKRIPIDAADALYNSHIVMQGTVDLNLTPGTYHIVFWNGINCKDCKAYGLQPEPKTVTAKFDLSQ
jgi:hypothetical protein